MQLLILIHGYIRISADKHNEGNVSVCVWVACVQVGGYKMIYTSSYREKKHNEHQNKKTNRHGRDLNPRSSVYETDALPLGHRACLSSCLNSCLLPTITQ